MGKKCGDDNNIKKKDEHIRVPNENGDRHTTYSTWCAIHADGNIFYLEIMLLLLVYETNMIVLCFQNARLISTIPFEDGQRIGEIRKFSTHPTNPTAKR